MPSSNLNSTNRAVDKFIIRLPKYLKEEIARYSKQYHRSMNSEIVVRLEESIAKENTDSSDQYPDGVKESTPASDEEIFKDKLSPFETRLIIFYRRLSANKRQALLSLFAN